MYIYQYGGKRGTQFNVAVADDMLVVRTRHNKTLSDALQSPFSKQVLTQLTPVINYAEADVTVLQCKGDKRSISALRDRARSTLKKEADIQFAGKVLRDKEVGIPVVYTENIFIKFANRLSPARCGEIIHSYGLKIKQGLQYAKNSYFVEAAEGTGLKVFDIARDLLDNPDVELCHPELIKPSAMRALSANQWHLAETTVNGRSINAHVNITPAWLHTQGEGTVIAVIDDGVDITHEEFSSADKVVAPFDATLNSDDPGPKSAGDNHGTACAGVACADGRHHASGVAPKAKLMPIRLRSGLGSQSEANAFVWAADHGADVISCSWGPADGKWWSPTDSSHQNAVAIPDNTRLAIDYAIEHGRGGKGCVITWAAGNGNESVENDGYASYDKVLAIAACNDTNSRSVYSDYGASIWCTFPSSDFGHADFNHPNPLTEGIWTTDRAGAAGYNPGGLNPTDNPPGDGHGHYTEQFGGTSSACPGAAGIAALMLSANAELRWDEVKDLLKRSCVKIDAENGSYGPQGHSPFYGYGRPDAEQAVILAKQHAEISAEPQIEVLSLAAQAAGSLPAAHAEQIFRVTLSGKTLITLKGPDGNDFDLYVRKGAIPTTQEYDEVSYSSDANESLMVTPTVPATYFVMVYSYQGAGDFSLNLSVSL